MEKTFFADIDTLNPTHYYLSEKKLADVARHFETHSLEDYPPIQVIKFNNKTIITKGHHYVYHLAAQGKLIAKAYENYSNEDFILNIKLLNECEKKNVNTVKDLIRRILSAEQYTQKWKMRFIEIEDKIASNPLSGLNVRKISDAQEKLQITDSVLSPVPSYFANDFIYETYVEKIRDMDFMAFEVFGHPLAFLALKPVYDNVLEIYLCGIMQKLDMPALSDRVIKEAIKAKRSLGLEYLSVKIPSKSTVASTAKKLYEFYKSHGFSHIESLEAPWDEKRLCMLLILK